MTMSTAAKDNSHISHRRLPTEEIGGERSGVNGEISFSPLEIEEPNLSLVDSKDNHNDGVNIENPLVGSQIEAASFHDDHHGAGPPGSAGGPQVVVNIIISFVGAGLLAMPEAFYQSGWLLGSVTLVVVSSFNVYAMLCLPQVQQILQQRHPAEILESYGDLGRVVLGRQGQWAIFLCLGISQAGFATAYIIFIAANLESIYGWSRLLICAFCVPGLLGLVQFRELGSLSPFSTLASTANFCALIAVLFQDFENYVPHNDTIHKAKPEGILHVIAITIYSMEGVGLVLSLKSSCKKPQDFSCLLVTTLSTISVFMVIFGSAGYAAFGNATRAPITLNMAHHWSASFVKCALCLGLYLTFPIMMFPIWNIIETPATSGISRILVRSSVVVCSCFVAYMIPHFGKFLALVGSSICTLLAFIFPCYFHLSVVGRDLPLYQKCLDVVLLIGGFGFGCVNTYRSVLDLLAGELEIR